MRLKLNLIILFACSFFFYLAIFSWAAGDNKDAQFYSQGLKALEEERYEEAISILEKALVYAPDSKKVISALSLAYNNYGVVLSGKTEKIEKAIFPLEKAVELSPDNLGYRQNLSDAYSYQARLIYEQKKDYNQSIKLALKALDYNPD